MTYLETSNSVPWHHGLAVQALDWLGLLAASMAFVEVWGWLW